MTTNLFAPLSSSNKSSLVEFKAGKMTFVNNKVTPDKRKGLVQLTKSADGLIHFVWKDRASGNVEDDLIIFPEEATFKRISQCTTGRVYLLEFKDTLKKHFFWLQEAKTDLDEDNCTKINGYINNPDQGGASGGIPGLGGIDQNALFQMLGGGGGGMRGAPSSGGAANPAANPLGVGMGDLQSILSGMGVPSSSLANMLSQQGAQQNSAPAPSTQTAPAARQEEGASLNQIMNADSVLPLVMNNPEIVNELLPLLPEGRRNPEEIAHVLRSPQFQQSLSLFSSALQSGQLTDMIRQFNIQTTGGPQTIEGFLTQLQNQANANRSNANEKKDKKDDDKMDTS